MDYEDLNDTMNAINDKAQDADKNLRAQYDKQKTIVTVVRPSPLPLAKGVTVMGYKSLINATYRNCVS